MVLHCCKAHERIDRKIVNLTPCKTLITEDFSLKLCTPDCIGDGNYCANVGADWLKGASPQIGEI